MCERARKCISLISLKQDLILELITDLMSFSREKPASAKPIALL
jgi:hypothetical protein